MGAAFAPTSKLGQRELWFPVYEEEKFVGALGSGDSAIAASWPRSSGVTARVVLSYGKRAGSMNVTVPDGLTWNNGLRTT